MRRVFVIFVVILFSFNAFAVDKSARIIGGLDTEIADAPWQVYARIGSTFCGGVLVQPQWVLIAAHCLDLASAKNMFTIAQPYQITVYSGTANAPNSGYTQYSSSVETVYVHQDYNPSTFANDIGLIKLTAPVKAPAIPITLIDEAELDDLFATENQGLDNLTISGWGDVEPNRNTSSFPVTLQQTNVSLVSDAACATLWGSTMTNVPDFQFKYLCTLGTQSGACSGDSGGPVVWNNPNFAGNADQGARLVGIVSFGLTDTCAHQRIPDVHTEVVNYRDWISDCWNGSCLALASNAHFSDDSAGGVISNLFFFFIVLLVMRCRRHGFDMLKKYR